MKRCIPAILLLVVFGPGLLLLAFLAGRSCTPVHTPPAYTPGATASMVDAIAPRVMAMKEGGVWWRAYATGYRRAAHDAMVEAVTMRTSSDM